MTPTHIFIGYIAVSLIARRTDALWAAVGSLVPDLPVLYFGVRALRCELPSRREFVRKLLEISFRYEKQHRGVKNVTSLFHSYVIWTPFVVLAFALSAPRVLYFVIGALLHCLADTFVHRKDAHQHFWPLSFRQIPGPWSFWEQGNGVIRTEIIISIVLTATAVAALMRGYSLGSF